MVYPYQYDKKYKHICMTCRSCVQLPLYLDGVDARIDTQTLKTPHIILVHLADLDNGINPDIFTINKERGDILLEFWIKIFTEKFLRYVNEVPFEMVKKP